MKEQITKTRIKQLNELLRFGKGKARLHKMLMEADKDISRSYIDQLINADGKLPNGITEKVRTVFIYAEILEKELRNEIKRLK